MNNVYFREKLIETPNGNKYNGLQATGETSAVVGKYLEQPLLLWFDMGLSAVGHLQVWQQIGACLPMV